MRKLFAVVFVLLVMSIMGSVSADALYSDYNYDGYYSGYYSPYGNYRYDYYDYPSSAYDRYDSYYSGSYYSGSSGRYYYDNPSAYLGYRTFTYGDPYRRGNFHYRGSYSYNRYDYYDYYSCGYYYCRTSYDGRSYY